MMKRVLFVLLAALVGAGVSLAAMSLRGVAPAPSEQAEQ